MRAAIARTSLVELVELGRFLDARVSPADGDDFLISGGVPLLWSEHAKALVVVGGLTRPRAIDEQGTTGERVYRRWTRGREPTTEREVEIDLAGTWKRLGRGLAIGYRSDKFHAKGSVVDYEHKFGPRVVVSELESSTGSVYVFRGGSLRLTSRGIEG